MKTNPRFTSSLLLLVAVTAVPLVGCKRLATDALDRGTELAFAQAGDGSMDVRIGHLPADFPSNVPLEPGAKVWAACRLPGDGGVTAWLATFHTQQSADQVRAFYDSKLTRMDAGSGVDFTSMFEATDLSSFGSFDLSPGSNKTVLSSAEKASTQQSSLYAFDNGWTVKLTTQQSVGSATSAAERQTNFALIVVSPQPQH